MSETTHNLALGSPDAPEQPLDVFLFPDTVEGILHTFTTALVISGGGPGRAVRVFGSVIAVDSGEPPLPDQVAVGWRPGEGHYRPIHEFNYDVQTELHPVVEQILALDLSELCPGTETMPGGSLGPR